jgi:hypothetical protein
MHPTVAPRHDQHHYCVGVLTERVGAPHHAATKGSAMGSHRLHGYGARTVRPRESEDGQLAEGRVVWLLRHLVCVFMGLRTTRVTRCRNSFHVYPFAPKQACRVGEYQRISNPKGLWGFGAGRARAATQYREYTMLRTTAGAFAGSKRCEHPSSPSVVDPHQRLTAVCGCSQLDYISGCCKSAEVDACDNCDPVRCPKLISGSHSHLSRALLFLSGCDW